MRTLAEMVAAGKAALIRKAADMKASWEAARTRMKDGYDKTPFGPTRKAAYKHGLDTARPYRVDAEKWADNWEAKMKE